MDLKELIRTHLNNARVMQLATVKNNKPWVCNVHFYANENLNIYWISTPARRHSLDIKENPNAAITIKVHEDTPEEDYVIGLSAEGKAERISDDEVKKIGKHYVSKLSKDSTLIEDILTGKKPYKFYRLTTSNFVLFDTKNFPTNPRQEYKTLT